MAYLAKKKINGKDYYYLMESKRINGKPRHSKQIYLGSVDDVVEKLSKATEVQPPLYTKDFELGNVAALYDLSKRLGLIEMMDGVSPKRDQGLSTGQYLLVAMINRAISPVSKSSLEEWYMQTMLSEWMPIREGMLSSQRFWDNVTRWDDKKTEEFEQLFLKKLVSEYNINPKCLIYDATNFFTYIDTNNEKASVAQRGHSKEKRNDLRIVGLSMMFSREDEIPLFYETYSGNTNDAKQFDSAIQRLKDKYYDVFGQEAEVTLVFDRGNNSEANIESLSSDFHYVGGLKMNQCGELCDIPKSRYQKATSEDLCSISYYRTKIEVFGKMHTVVITDNPNLENGQLQGIKHHVQKCTEKLGEVNRRLEGRRKGEIKGGKRPTVESITKNVDKILSNAYMKKLMQYEVTEGADGIPKLCWKYSELEMDWLREHELGKTILFTSRDGWDSEEIIKAYRSAWKIEHAFRQMKDSKHLSVRPLYCWTDQKIKVHIFCCVMAVRLCSILKKELNANGMDIGINEMIDCLGKKKQYVHYYQQKRGLKKIYSLSETYEQTEKMMEILNLKTYEMKS